VVRCRGLLGTVKHRLPFAAALCWLVTACQAPPVQAPVPRRAAQAAPTPTDSDGDGIVDSTDECPTRPEDPDGIDDSDGCPETDADHDDIDDTEDACPLQPGGFLAEQPGCPYVLPNPPECPPVAVPTEIPFLPEDATLATESRRLVRIVARDVATLPSQYTLFVIGHRGHAESVDRGLERAHAVRDALIQGGLAAERIHLVNRADRDTTAAQTANYRVSFRIDAACTPSRSPDYDFQEPLPSRTLPADAPAMRYANLSPLACRAELKKRELPVARDRRPTPGVATGVRFTGPVHDVTFISPGRASLFGVMDCRLALALADAAELLSQRGVVRLRIDNTYRRGARLPIRHHGRSQHAYGLAADITAFVLADGRDLQVERDWDGQIGDPVCGPTATLEEPTESAIALRDIACELGRRGLFHTMLTPNYNAAHHNHFHFDIKRDKTRWNIH